MDERRADKPTLQDPDLCRRTQAVWELYLTARTAEEVAPLLELLAPECVIIGTGRHEFHTSREHFLKAMAAERAEREEIRFRIEDQWYSRLDLGADICLIYGGVHVMGRGLEGGLSRVVVDMDTRFSMIYRRVDEDWKVVHVHQSLPDLEQAEGEYYPKTLSQQVQEAIAMAERMQALARRDALTSLLNHRGFFEQAAQRLEQGGPCWCMVMDLDHFKRVNDTLGHLAGDRVLRKVAEAMRACVRAEDLLGRTGGDEFALICSGPEHAQEVSGLAQRLLDRLAEAGREEPCWPGVSIGIARLRPGEGLDSVLNRADAALYEVKRSGRNGYRFAQEAAE